MCLLKFLWRVAHSRFNVFVEISMTNSTQQINTWGFELPKIVYIVGNCQNCQNGKNGHDCQNISKMVNNVNSCQKMSKLSKRMIMTKKMKLQLIDGWVVKFSE